MLTYPYNAVTVRGPLHAAHFSEGEENRSQTAIITCWVAFGTMSYKRPSIEQTPAPEPGFHAQWNYNRFVS